MPRKKLPITKCLACGAETPKSNRIYCSLSCQKRFEHDTFIERWLAGEESGRTGIATVGTSQHIRKYLMKKRGEQCERCGWKERHPVTGEVPLELHHKDGDGLNNQEGNLTFLCPNCHSLTETYRGRNKGRGRKQR